MKRLKTFLIYALLLVFALTGIVGCSQDTEIPAGYDIKVTYYLSGGQIELYQKETSIDIYYKSGSKIIEPGKSSTQFKEVTLKGYSVGGWYLAETDESGNVVMNSKGEPVASSEKFDFATQTVTKDITLVVVWNRSIRVVFENLHYSASNPQLVWKQVCTLGASLNQPSFLNSYDADKKTYPVEGYYWNYDSQTDTYSDPVSFPVEFRTLDEKVQAAGEPVEEDGYVIFKIYTKLGPVQNGETAES